VSAPRFAAPLSAVDELDARSADGRLLLSVRKHVVADDPYLPAHFPGRPVYPGVFILETVRQAVSAALGEVGGAVADLASVAALRFVGALRPGESLWVEAAVGAAGPDGGIPVEARCRRADGSDVARLKLEFRYPATDD